MSQQLQLQSKILKSQLGQRLDQAIAGLFLDYSRSQIKKWIINNKVQVNGKIINRPKEKVFGNEQVIINVLIKKEDILLVAQNIPLNIIYEDDEILVINKPCDFVVHPGVGNPNGTVLNALLYHYPNIINIPRAGIVHRLDKDTIGLMVIAKTITAQAHLIKAFHLRKITREYEAIVNGRMTVDGTINKPIARHPTKRTHMAVCAVGKIAITHYKIMEHFRAHTRLRLQLESGRMHQIRVHMAYIKHPLVGDPLYGCYQHQLKNVSGEFCKIIKNFNRQALYAMMLRLYHPRTNIEMEWKINIPEDMVILINILKKDAVMNKDTMDF
ncbi:MAG: 23S rRNA pseudouridine(1911/1915/1917) synthase RluD [Arsenophonus sp. ET-DL9-MAG3]